MKGYVRAVLVVLAAYQLVLGLWLLFFPFSFYDDVPTVDWTPPYSEHLFRDFGGATLGLAVVLIAAAIRMDRVLSAVALLAYLVGAIPHLFFHLEHLDGDSAWLSFGLAAVLTVSVLAPLSALLALRRVP